VTSGPDPFGLALRARAERDRESHDDADRGADDQAERHLRAEQQGEDQAEAATDAGPDPDEAADLARKRER